MHHQNLDKIISIINNASETSLLDAEESIKKEAENDNLSLEIKTRLNAIIQACQLELSHADWETPFQLHRMTISPNEIVYNKPENIQLFDSIIFSITNNVVKARILDILYTEQPNKKGEYSKLLLDAYMAIPIEPNAFFANKSYYSRMISIAYRTNKNIINTIKTSFLKAINKYNSHKKFVLEATEIFKALKFSKAEATIIKEALVKSANYKESIEKYNEIKYSLSLLNKSLNWCSNEEEKEEINIKIAILHLSISQNSNNPTISLNNANNAKKIFLHLRNKTKEDKFIKALITKTIETANRIESEIKNSLPKSKTVMYKQSLEIINMVENLSSSDVALFFSELFPLIQYNKEIKEKSRLEQIRPRCLHEKNTTIISRHSKLLSNTPEECERINEMLHHGKIILERCKKIVDCLNSIKKTEKLSNEILHDIVNKSPIIADDRKELVFRGLSSGFYGDIPTAMHILTPQLENIVRCHLKSKNENTSHQSNNDYCENELAIGALLTSGHDTGSIDENVFRELFMLFAEKTGANIRNEIAHGLINYQAAESVHFIYGFWLIFKLIYNSNKHKTKDLNILDDHSC